MGRQWHGPLECRAEVCNAHPRGERLMTRQRSQTAAQTVQATTPEATASRRDAVMTAVAIRRHLLVVGTALPTLFVRQ